MHSQNYEHSISVPVISDLASTFYSFPLFLLLAFHINSKSFSFKDEFGFELVH